MICRNLIKANVAPKGTKQISVYNESGKRVGRIPLNSLAFPQTSERLYSFGAISDVHVVYDTAEADLQRALMFFNSNKDIDFVCICGDLTDQGTETELTKYKNVVSSSITKPVYAVAGNHEHFGSRSSSYLSSYTGRPLCYTVDVGDDVFIMVGIASATAESVFYENTLQWLYAVLEANRNKRCFLFQHILYPEGSGDILSLYPYTKLGGTQGKVFKSLLKHYKNVIFFHGHSHMKFGMQVHGMTANYDNAFGIHSVHIPSLAVPRDDIDGDRVYDTIYADSEGYVVDVYENGIHLKGRDFIKGEYLPIASYWLDTTLKEVEANTYTDQTNTIDPSNTEIPEIGVPEEPDVPDTPTTTYTNYADTSSSDWLINKRLNSSWEIVDSTGQVLTNCIDLSDVKEYIAVKGIKFKDDGNGRIIQYKDTTRSQYVYLNTNAQSRVTVADYDSSVYIIPKSLILEAGQLTTMVRFGGVLTGTSDNVVIAIDEKIIGTPIKPETPTVKYTNQIPISTDASGNIFDGIGYREKTRISSKGVLSSIAGETATNHVFVTGLIPIKQGDIVRLKNCYIDSNNVANKDKYGINGWACQTAYLDYRTSTQGDGLSLCVWTDYRPDNTSNVFVKDVVLDSNGYVTQFTAKSQYPSFMQLVLAPTGSPADAIVTVNEEITE